MAGQISVVNKRNFDGEGLYIGRPTIFGNPFSHSIATKAEFVVSSRKEAVEKYGEWIREQYGLGGEIKTTIDKLVEFYLDGREITFICWCKPALCHGDILKDFVLELAELVV